MPSFRQNSEQKNNALSINCKIWNEINNKKICYQSTKKALQTVKTQKFTFVT